MTTKKTVPKGQSGEAIPTMEIKKPGQADQIQATEKNESTVEELQRELGQLKKKLLEVPQDLNARIEYFNQKKELIRKLSRLNANAEGLLEHLDKIAELAAANEFENDVYTLSIESGDRYNKKQVFALQNPIIIAEVINFMLGKVEAKADELKKQIES